jgi:hypothetical protein
MQWRADLGSLNSATFVTSATCRKRTCTCAPCALHTLQHVQSDRNERTRAFPHSEGERHLRTSDGDDAK